MNRNTKMSQAKAALTRIGFAVLIVLIGRGVINAEQFEVGESVQIDFLNETIEGTVVETRSSVGPKVKFEFRGREREMLLRNEQVKKLIKKPEKKKGADSSSASSGISNVEKSVRTWTSKSGNHKFNASLVEFDRGANQVTLKNADSGQVIKVPTSKLHQDDLNYLEQLTDQQEQDENPFAIAEIEIEEDKSSEENAGDVSQAKTISLVPILECNLEPDVGKFNRAATGTSIEVEPTNSRHPTLGGFELSRNRRLATFTTKDPFEKRAVIQAFHLVSGKTVGSFEVADDHYFAADISDDGKRIVVAPTVFAQEARIEIWQLDASKQFQKAIEWDMPSERSSRNVIKLAKFIDDDHLLTLGESGTVYLWDTNKGTAIYRVELGGGASFGQPVFSANRRYVAFNHGRRRRIIFLETLTGKSVASIPAPRQGAHGLAFSDNGLNFVGHGNGLVSIWDLTSGELIREFDLSNSRGNAATTWVGDDQILVGDRLIDVRLRAQVWKFSLPFGVQALTKGEGNLFWYPFSQPGDESRTIVPIRLPIPELAEPLRKLKPNNLLVIKPGDKVFIDLDELPFEADEIDKIRNGLTKKLDDVGLVLGDGSSPIVIQATVKNEKEQTEEYESRSGQFSWLDPRRRRGPLSRRFADPVESKLHKVSFTPTTSTLVINADGQTVWKMSVKNSPANFIRVKGDQTVDDTINEACKPNPRFFIMRDLPKYLAILPDNQEFLGRSQLTRVGM